MRVLVRSSFNDFCEFFWSYQFAILSYYWVDFDSVICCFKWVRVSFLLQVFQRHKLDCAFFCVKHGTLRFLQRVLGSDRSLRVYRDRQVYHYGVSGNTSIRANRKYPAVFGRNIPRVQLIGNSSGAENEQGCTEAIQRNILFCAPITMCCFLLDYPCFNCRLFILLDIYCGYWRLKHICTLLVCLRSFCDISGVDWGGRNCPELR